MSTNNIDDIECEVHIYLAFKVHDKGLIIIRYIGAFTKIVNRRHYTWKIYLMKIRTICWNMRIKMYLKCQKVHI